MNREEKLKNRETLVLKLKNNTTLLIWIGYDGTVGEDKVNPPSHVWMRIDKYQQYWVPFEAGYEYLKGKVKILDKLVKFGFKSEISNLSEILQITEELEDSLQLRW